MTTTDTRAKDLCADDLDKYIVILSRVNGKPTAVIGILDTVTHDVGTGGNRFTQLTISTTKDSSIEVEAALGSPVILAETFSDGLKALTEKVETLRT